MKSAPVDQAPPPKVYAKRKRRFGGKKRPDVVMAPKKKVIVLEEIEIEGKISVDEDFDELDAHRGRIPSSKRFVKYPLLVMNNPEEPAVDLERGGKSSYVNTSTKAYVISGNVTCLNNMDQIDVEIKTIRNEEVVDSSFIDASNLKKTQQSMYFEKEVHLLPGITELEVRAIGENGYSVFETFELSYSPDSSKITEGKDHLIVMGIDEYKSWPDLENAVNDAKSVKNALVSFYGIDSSNVHTLFDSSCNRIEIDNLFRLLRHQIGENDRVVVYFAGHGYYDHDFDQGYWVTHEAGNGQPSTYLANSDITMYMKSFKSRHTLFIADACFSGTYYATSRGARTRTDRLNSEKSRWMFCSGGEEKVADDYNGSGHSPFAFYLLQYLNEPPSKEFSISDLSTTVVKNVSLNSNQVPVAKPIQNAGDEGGEWIFKKR